MSLREKLYPFRSERGFSGEEYVLAVKQIEDKYNIVYLEKKMLKRVPDALAKADIDKITD